MKKLLIILMVAGLYAQKVELVKVWEKDVPAHVKANDIVFLDENGYNVFSVACKDPEKALRNKKILMIERDRIKWYEGDDMRLVKEIKMKGQKVISKNGKNIAVLQLIGGKKTYEEKRYGFEEGRKGLLILLNSDGKELAKSEIDLSGWEYIHLYPLGNDKTVVINFSGGEGRYHKVCIFVRKENTFVEVFSHKGYIWDYSEDGNTMLISAIGKGRLIMNGEGKIIGSFQYGKPRGNYWAGVSPHGNYIAEVTAGKYLVIHNKYGNLIKEHKVQGQGNYYGSFSHDGKYLCLTPGFRKIYFIEVPRGKILWEYKHKDDKPSFFPKKILNLLNNILALIVYTPSKKEPKELWIFNNKGEIINKLGPFEFEGYSLRVSVTPDYRYLLLKIKDKINIYEIQGGE